jgi:hypothetical protein
MTSCHRYNHRRHRKVHRQQAITSSFDDAQSPIRASRIQIECLGDRQRNPEFLAATDATDTIIVAPAKVHHQQAITSSVDDGTRIPKSAQVAFKLNASETVSGTPNF